jgi:hypothetical protein
VLMECGFVAFLRGLECVVHTSQSYGEFWKG